MSEHGAVDGRWKIVDQKTFESSGQKCDAKAKLTGTVPFADLFHVTMINGGKEMVFATISTYEFAEGKLELLLAEKEGP